jgi:asparagine synthase (glutamine-hydrolysing)
MSVQFGRWNLDGSPVGPGYVEKAMSALSSYGLDECRSYANSNTSILYFAFHTTKESRLETQPHLLSTKAVLTWDGRLDNRREIMSELTPGLTLDCSDVAIVSAAYEAWGTRSFRRLIGDWALSIWDPAEQSVILAKDPIGARSLYYALDEKHVTWSTVLDPLVRLAGKTFILDEEYIAGWFSFFPSVHRTPYTGIHSVSPSSAVHINARKHTTNEYWNFDHRKKVRHRSDAEFRAVFAQSVERRLRSDLPVLAELSGGLDSSSIVCMADSLNQKRTTEDRRLDTVSYYDDSEPNWDERPFFTKIEEKRGRSGCHINVSGVDAGRHDFANEDFAATPGSASSRPNEATAKFSASLASDGHRVLLSGIGGDEVTGGVPTPVPELADLIAKARFRTLASQLKAWALIQRRPWLHILLETAREFFPIRLVGVSKHMRPAPWLHSTFVKRNSDAFIGYGSSFELFGAQPSFQENLSTLNVLRRQLHCFPLPSHPPYEKRYPYLDRDLLEFLYAIPREQLVRPGQRRSLMRRALLGIVPEEVLNRKRKAFVVRSPMKAIAKDWTCLTEMSNHMVSAELRMVDAKVFREALENTRRGEESHIVALMRTIQIECWLRHLTDRRFLQLRATNDNKPSGRFSTARTSRASPSGFRSKANDGNEKQ